MSIEEFNYTSLRDIDNIVRGYTEKTERESRQRFEVMRIQTSYLVNIQLDKSDRKSANELMPFDWDEKTEEMGEDEKQRHRDLIERKINKLRTKRNNQ